MREADLDRTDGLIGMVKNCIEEFHGADLSSSDAELPYPGCLLSPKGFRVCTPDMTYTPCLSPLAGC